MEEQEKTEVAKTENPSQTVMMITAAAFMATVFFAPGPLLYVTGAAFLAAAAWFMVTTF